MKFLSLFSGVGGFDLGLERAGMECVGQVEIDPYRREVLERHWPEVERYNDVRTYGLQRSPDHESVDEDECEAGRPMSHARRGRAGIADLICGGFPCQDLSVAGKRAGLAGSRSGLWWEFERIIGEVRPTWVLIENVCGLLSSNGGDDFALILDSLGKLGYGWAYRILDSRFFGVPQRRRRVYVVGYLGGRCDYPASVLFEPEGGGGDTQASGAAGEDVAYALSASVRGTGDGHGNAWNSTYVAEHANVIKSGPPGTRKDDFDGLVANPLGAKDASGYRLDLDHETYIPEVAYSLRQSGGGISQREDDNTLVSATVTSKWAKHSGGPAGSETGNLTTHTLDGTAGDAVHAQSVRRLTPVECERLQGLPDGHTDLGGTKDGPRYAAMGDAVTVPVIQWIGERMMRAHNA